MPQKKNLLINFLLIFAGGAAAFLLIKKTFFLLAPIFLAYLFSEVIRNSLSKIHPLGEPVKRILTVLLLLIFFAFLSLLVVLLAERFLHYATKITEFLSGNSESITSFFKEQIKKLENTLSSLLGQNMENRFTLYLPTLFQDFIKKGLSLLPIWIGKAAGCLPRFFISLIIFIISCYYFSCDWKRIRSFAEKNFSGNLLMRLSLMKKHFFRSLRQYTKAYLLLFLLTFSILYLGLTLLKSKNALGSAFLIALVDLLPVLGCGTVLLPWALFAFLTGKSGVALCILILYITTLLCHQFAEPKIVGSSIGLHPILSLVLVLLGLRFFGFWGMLLLPLGCTSFLNAQSEIKKITSEKSA